MRSVIALVALLASLASTPRPTPTPHVAPQIMAAAKQWFHAFQTGKVDRSKLNSLVNVQLTDAMIHSEARVLQRYKNPTSFVFASSEPVNGVTGYDFVLSFPKARIIESIAFDDGGLLAGIDFRVFALKPKPVKRGVV
jgi:hypothetical protein